MEFKELFEPIINFIKGLQNKDKENSKDEAKKRLQLVLMQDRASVSPDFFEMMKKEIIEVIKKYIEIDEDALEVELTRGFEDGVTGPALFANIPIKNIKPIAKKVENKEETSVDEEEIDNPKEEEAAKEEEPAEDIQEEKNEIENAEQETHPDESKEEAENQEEKVVEEVKEEPAPQQEETKPKSRGKRKSK